MANQSTLKHDDHMILDQPLLKVPYELLRKNFRTAHFVSERESASLKTSLKETATASMGGGAGSAPADALRSLDAMIARMHGLQRKLAACADEEARLTRQLGARVAHLADLQAMRSFDDGSYDGWSRRRLDVLLVDYLLRQGYNATAADLAREKGLEDLVDVKTFLQMSRIREALLAGSVAEALAWCLDNKKELRGLKDHKNLLEFSLRFQQYVELVRTQEDAKLLEAIAHAKKYLQPFRDAFPERMRQACGLLVSPPTLRGSEYAFLYAPERWVDLADLFTRTHGQLLALPPTPLLHIALGVGLSALKTPACHASGRPPMLTSGGSNTTAHVAGTAATAGSSGAIPTHSTALTQSVCPICSTELNELARGVPYAHHTQSHVEADLVMLPNRRVYGRARLEDYARKSGLPEGQVKDLRTGEIYPQHELKKVFIT